MLPCAVTLVLLDPFTVRWVIENVTSASYWRTWWAVPLPMLMALCLVAPLQLARGPVSRALVLGGVAAAAAAFAFGVPEFSALSPRNQGPNPDPLTLGWPRLKVREEGWRWAGILNEKTRPGAPVLAPPNVGVWVPTFAGHAYPLEVRESYLRLFREQIGAKEMKRRHRLALIAAGEKQDEADLPFFRRSLGRYGIEAVLLRRGELIAELRKVLREAGFRPSVRDLSHELWVRDASQG